MLSACRINITFGSGKGSRLLLIVRPSFRNYYSNRRNSQNRVRFARVIKLYSSGVLRGMGVWRIQGYSLLPLGLKKCKKYKRYVTRRRGKERVSKLKTFHTLSGVKGTSGFFLCKHFSHTCLDQYIKVNIR